MVLTRWSTSACEACASGGPPHSLQGVSDASVVMTVAAGRVVYEA